jgi:6-phosphogluconolactonase/glucosamine-6-phosphate isomerase/deaminase
MEIIRGENAREEAGHALTTALVQNGDHPILLMLSGGSALQILDSVPNEVLGTHITLSVLDERYSTDPHVNNFAQLKTTDFFARATESGAQVISTEITNETPEETAVQWEVSLRVWKSVHPDGVVVATMGVGFDGHTAGIFGEIPGVNFSGESLVVAYSVPKEVHEYTERITTTFTFLTEWIHEAVVYAVGEEKKEVLTRLEKGVCTREEMPACIFHEMQSVKVYTNVRN